MHTAHYIFTVTNFLNSPLSLRLNFGVPLSYLPRESRLCFTLHGLENSGSTERPWNRSPIAWVAQRLFNSQGVLISGPRLLGLWGADDAVDPLDSPYPNSSANKCPFLELIFDDSGERVTCDEPPPRRSATPSPAKPGPAPSIYRGLKKMATRDRFTRYILYVHTRTCIYLHMCRDFRAVRLSLWIASKDVIIYTCVGACAVCT